METMAIRAVLDPSPKLHKGKKIRPHLNTSLSKSKQRSKAVVQLVLISYSIKSFYKMLHALPHLPTNPLAPPV